MHCVLGTQSIRHPGPEMRHPEAVADDNSLCSTCTPYPPMLVPAHFDMSPLLYDTISTYVHVFQHHFVRHWSTVVAEKPCLAL